MKIVEYRVKMVEYRVKMVEYRVKLVEYRVKLVDIKLKLWSKIGQVLNQNFRLSSYMVIMKYHIHYCRFM